MKQITSIKPFEAEASVTEPVLEQILRAIKKIRYGSVEITIHDAHVVQIECREKLRLQGEGISRKR